MKAKFELGRCYLTPSARFELEASDYPFECLLIRHQQGDWGNVAFEDKQTNDAALVNGSRLFSAYLIESTKFWVITEADRSSTTILLPSEY